MAMRVSFATRHFFEGTNMKFTAMPLAVLLLGSPMFCASQTSTGAGNNAVPRTPASIKGVLEARRFTLQTPYRYTWSKEPMSVSSGTLVVLAVDPAYVVPREAPQPVLYAGDVPLHRLNRGQESGRVIGIIPGDIDLAAAPIWFGSPELPERVTSAMVRTEKARALTSGLRPMASAKIAGIDASPIVAKDLAALLRGVGADLVLQYSPQEKFLADTWRLPVAGER
jgi:hypothetical protein